MTGIFDRPDYSQTVLVCGGIGEIETSSAIQYLENILNGKPLPQVPGRADDRSDRAVMIDAGKPGQLPGIFRQFIAGFIRFIFFAGAEFKAVLYGTHMSRLVGTFKSMDSFADPQWLVKQLHPTQTRND